jgi:hypothetical protein
MSINHKSEMQKGRGIGGIFRAVLQNSSTGGGRETKTPEKQDVLKMVKDSAEQAGLKIVADAAQGKKSLGSDVVAAKRKIGNSIRSSKSDDSGGRKRQIALKTSPAKKARKAKTKDIFDEDFDSSETDSS